MYFLSLSLRSRMKTLFPPSFYIQKEPKTQKPPAKNRDGRFFIIKKSSNPGRGTTLFTESREGVTPVLYHLLRKKGGGVGKKEKNPPRGLLFFPCERSFFRKKHTPPETCCVGGFLYVLETRERERSLRRGGGAGFIRLFIAPSPHPAPPHPARSHLPVPQKQPPPHFFFPSHVEGGFFLRFFPKRGDLLGKKKGMFFGLGRGGILIFLV